MIPCSGVGVRGWERPFHNKMAAEQGLRSWHTAKEQGGGESLQVTVATKVPGMEIGLGSEKDAL